MQTWEESLKSVSFFTKKAFPLSLPHPPGVYGNHREGWLVPSLDWTRGHLREGGVEQVRHSDCVLSNFRKKFDFICFSNQNRAKGKSQDTYFLETGVELYRRSTGSDSVDNNLMYTAETTFRQTPFSNNPNYKMRMDATRLVCVCLLVRAAKERCKLSLRRYP